MTELKFFNFNLPPTLQHPILTYNNKKYILKYQVYKQDNTFHRMPNWMSPKLHLILEYLLDHHFGIIARSILGIPYHILFGLICGYNMKEIICFLKKYYGENRE